MYSHVTHDHPSHKICQYHFKIKCEWDKNKVALQMCRFAWRFIATSVYSFCKWLSCPILLWKQRDHLLHHPSLRWISRCYTEEVCLHRCAAKPEHSLDDFCFEHLYKKERIWMGCTSKALKGETPKPSSHDLCPCCARARCSAYLKPCWEKDANYEKTGGNDEICLRQPKKNSCVQKLQHREPKL